MKYILMFVISICFAVTGLTQERKFNFYPNIAVDLGGAIPFPLSDIPDGAGGTPEPFPSLGLGTIFLFNERWNFSGEINYHLIAFSADADVTSQPFFFNDGSAQYFSGKTQSDIELRLLEFPFLAYYKLNNNRKLIMGAYYARILEGRFETKGINGIYSPDKNITDNAILPGPEYTIEYSFNEHIDSYDFGVMLGYQYSLSDKVFFWGRLNVGFKSIFKKEFINIDYEMYQVRINLGLSYFIFG